jgi:hypothetical protein
MHATARMRYESFIYFLDLGLLNSADWRLPDLDSQGIPFPKICYYWGQFLSLSKAVPHQISAFGLGLAFRAPAVIPATHKSPSCEP